MKSLFISMENSISSSNTNREDPSSSSVILELEELSTSDIRSNTNNRSLDTDRSSISSSNQQQRRLILDEEEDDNSPEVQNVLQQAQSRRNRAEEARGLLQAQARATQTMMNVAQMWR